MPADWLLVGPRGSRRIAALQQARRERGLPPAAELDYQTVLDAPARAAERFAAHPGAVVKLESPGEAPALHAALVQRGWQRLGEPGPRPAPLAHGELAWQHYWFAGFQALLQTLPPQRDYLNPPEDIAAMSDKLACQQRLASHGVGIPALFGPVSGYPALRERLAQAGCSQAFLKPRYGSSGAGVLAYRRHRDGREALYGSAELVEHGGRARVFNSLRPRRYEDSRQIARLVDAVCAQQAYLERWVPKPRAPAQHGGDSAGGALGRYGGTGYDGHYDIRLVAFDGRPRQRVARIARTPLTNLHLGNRRGRLEDWLPPPAMQALERAALHASAAFPRSRLIGFDLIHTPRGSWVLEANAFGDLLPGLHWQGRDTYQDQAAWSPPHAAQATVPPPERAHA